MTFPSTDKPLCTNESFNSLTDEDHVAKSPCFVCKIGLVTEFPTDEMHSVYLGVMRRFIMFWL